MANIIPDKTLDTIHWMAENIILTFSDIFRGMFEYTIGEIIASLPGNFIPASVIEFLDFTGITSLTHLELLIATGLPVVMAWSIFKWITDMIS